MRKLLVLLATVGAILIGLVGVSLAQAGDKDNDWNAKAKLIGYNETPAAISTTGRGSFAADIESDQIRFKLSWENLQGGNATASHIHFGQPHTTGGVSVWFCGGGGKPACPAGNGSLEGTIVAADVIGPSGQGIAAGEFAELLQAIKHGSAYVNVHTGTYPGGEIRGQIKSHGGKGKGHDKD